MAENKTKPTKQSIKDYLSKLESTSQKQDAAKLVDIIQQVTHAKPVIWGSSMVGFKL
jgi:hypothetical protein